MKLKRELKWTLLSSPFIFHFNFPFNSQFNFPFNSHFNFPFNSP
jgi:hypothetical protein